MSTLLTVADRGYSWKTRTVLEDERPRL